jgi:hypothetical protein
MLVHMNVNGPHDTDELYYMHQCLYVFINIWPDDGLFRPKLVANILNNEIQKSCDRPNTYFISFPYKACFCSTQEPDLLWGRTDLSSLEYRPHFPLI